MQRLPVEDLDHVISHTAAVWPGLRGSSIFITGGTGFVGLWLLESLAWANENARLGASIQATLLTRNPDGFRQKAPHLADLPWLKLLSGDICSFEFPEAEFPFVIHAATEKSFDATASQPLSTFDRD